MASTMTTAELRTIFGLLPVTLLHRRIREARKTMKRPQIPAHGPYLASGPNVILCARTIACMRAELARRDTYRQDLARIACEAWTAPDGAQLAEVRAKVRAFEAARNASKGV